MKINRGAGEFIVPTDARAEFKATVQRANRRILSNVDYIKREGIRDNETRQMLAFDFHSKRGWETKSAPLSASTKFASEKQYKAYMKFIQHWGEDRGKRGDFAAAPSNIRSNMMSDMIVALNGWANRKGISLEEWGGELPPEIMERLSKLSLTQLRKSFDYIFDDGGAEEFDSDDTGGSDIEDWVDYLNGKLSAVEKFYPYAPKPKKKKRRKKTKSAQKKARKANRKKR